ncbi:hypothetical protein J2751_001051 [Halorubrum alkaliphilum]|uniref:SipW-cognate class signal peptide n=1 Tax=Halorubrum alkaliphilum TaxID=261290 RepID=A0A8T4GD42_9EURY|nr:hypothetical protein [Halorubrum alkaliphilum]MBP1922046.1 hypothetical protein [Halorubrum alkaliphilum]
MSNRNNEVTRRQALAGVGAVGFATVGLIRGRSTGSWGDYTNYTYAERDGRRLLVGWQTTYNGFRSADVIVDGPTDEEDFADGVADVRLIDLDDVLPGDEGAASVGLRVEDDIEEGLRAWLRLVPTIGTDAASRDLADRLHVDLRYDDGLLGLGGCEGADGDFSGFGTPIYEGSFADLVDDDLAEGVLIDPGLFDNGCLTPDAQRCLVLYWRFPTGRGNAGSGGSVDFDVTFGVDPCGAGTESPFSMEGSS